MTRKQSYKQYLKRSRILNWNWQKYLIKLFDNPLGRWYLGVPRGKKIYKITSSSVHYYTGELSKRNGLPVICTGGCSPGGRFVFNRIMKLAKVVSVFAFLPLFPKSLLPLIALTDTGYKSPTATGGKYNQWTNPTYAYIDDTNYATTTESAGSDKRQSYETFGFGILSGTTINGIETTTKGYYVGDNQNNYVRWWCQSDGDWTVLYSAAFLSGAEQTITKGGSTDLWGRTPIDTDFSDANFSVYVSGRRDVDDCTYYLNHIQVKVYYTEAAAETFVYPEALALSVSQPAPTQNYDYQLSVSALGLALSQPEIEALVGQIVELPVLGLVAEMPIPVLNYDYSLNVSALALILAQQNPTIDLQISVLLEALGLISTIKDPTLKYDYVLALESLGISLNLPEPLLRYRSKTAYTDKYSKRNTVYTEKYSKRGTIYHDKYSKRGTHYCDKFF